MAALPALMTVEQFRNMPDDGRAYELHYADVVTVPLPNFGVYNLQCHIAQLLGTKLAGFGQAGIEFPYRTLSEFDLRAADLSVVRQERWQEMDDEDNLHGAPDLVIEVKSPSQTRGQLQELATLCLNTGAQEFWIVDPAKRTVTVIRRDRLPKLYAPGDNIPLDAFGAEPLDTASVFG